jgi:2-polyprenyl-3-methyl-5-hydroxy-6-metoxy-1,4-benzoquinol methylase
MPDHNASLKGDHAVYSASMRKDILPLFDRAYERILDIGCSTGNTGVMLKEQQLCQWVTGVELFEQTAQIARDRLDQVIVGCVEQAIGQLPDESFDGILCLDVLEHLVDPWSVVKQLSAKLKPGGIFITSIPNIRHISIVVKLCLLGRWTYTDSGILDRTHLRFFTKRSCMELLDIPQLELEKMSRLVSPCLRAAQLLSFGLLNGFVTSQYLTRSRKRIAWEV